MPTPTPPPYKLAVPGPTTTAPRDGLPLNRTQDDLFLAVLMERSRATGWVVGAQGPDGNRTYEACPPPADPQSRRGGPVYLSTKTLRRRLVQDSTLFAIRRFCQQPTPNGASLSVADYDLTQNGNWGAPEFGAIYLSLLTPPIELGKTDPLIRRLPATPLFSWCDLNASEPATAVHGGDWICPNCGIISATHGIWSSPPETWAIRCGRAYQYQLCVTCLLVFSRQLAARN